MDDCFEVLGLLDTASLIQVKAAYRKLAEAHHPDKGGSPSEFIKLNEAYRQACKCCEKPLVCTICEGSGTIEQRKGWRVAYSICAGCGGSGTNPR